MITFRFFLSKTAFVALALACSTRINAQVAELPTPLRPDIQVEHFMSVGPKCVRLIQNPVSGDFYYTTFDGDVFRVKMKKGKKPVCKKVYTAKDHGITRLQGAAFLNGTLFLVGNVSVNNNKGTKGRMVKYESLPSGKRQLSRGHPTVVFMTDEVGGTKTIYDHGFNGVAVSPDGQYLYVNSGARTDHGEVQDNGGLYPNSRDEALTACVLRIPTNATDLLLPNDSAKLVAGGYLFAKGIRNAYDLAFAPNGHLFAVSNSGDYDHPEDMFWLRQGHHYGYPWVMGGLENPQQYPDWQPDADKDPFINKFSHSYRVKYFRNDPDFPKKPANVSFTAAVQNTGPDANSFRDRTTGKIVDADKAGLTLGTFTPHLSPLGLFFDVDSLLTDDLKGDGFVISYSNGKRSVLMSAFTSEGEDLMHLKLTYHRETDNYSVQTTRLVEGFREPSDALMIGNVVYVIEYGGKAGNIWKITLPADKNTHKNKL